MYNELRFLIPTYLDLLQEYFQYHARSARDITLLNLKLTAFLPLLGAISGSVCFALKLQWTHQLEFSSSFSYKYLLIIPRQWQFYKYKH